MYKNSKGNSKGGKTPRNTKSRNNKPGKAQNFNTGSEVNLADKRERWAAFKSNKTKEFENDPSWYNKFGALSKNVTNFNFNVPVGSRVDWGPAATAAYPAWNDDRFPGVMSLFFSPAFGDKYEGNTSPLNMAANRLYQWTRFENNGSSVYDRGDLMLYLVAMDSAYMYFAFLRRIYGLVKQYSTLNRYTPRAFIQANRVDFDSVQRHVADLRGYINQYAARLSMLPIPKDLPYLKRHMWMCDNVFLDEDVARCQMYMFVPFYFAKFGVETEGADVGKPFVDFERPSYGGLLDYEDLESFGDSLIEPLVAEEDFNLIGADIIKAFGTTGLFTVEEMPDDYTTPFVYSEEVLDQIQNAVSIGNPTCVPTDDGVALNKGHAIWWDSDTNTLVPYNSTWGPLVARYAGQVTGRLFMGNRLINFEKDNVSHDDLLVATRLTPAVVSWARTGVGNWIYLTLQGIGSEIINSMIIYFYTADNIGDGVEINWRVGQTHGIYYSAMKALVAGNYSAGMSAEDFAAVQGAVTEAGKVMSRDNARQFGLIDKFRRHPAVYVNDLYYYVEPDDTDQGWHVQGISTGSLNDYSRYRLGDVDNYVMLTPEDLRALSEVAVMSEFFVPLAAEGPVRT